MMSLFIKYSKNIYNTIPSWYIFHNPKINCIKNYNWDKY